MDHNSITNLASADQKEEESSNSAKVFLDKMVPKQLTKDDAEVVHYQGFWCPKLTVPNVIAFQREFKAQDTDIIVATKMKSGTTWLKSLVFSVVNRSRFSNSNHPLLTHNPHKLVPNFEFDIYSPDVQDDWAKLESFHSPRVLSTHLPYSALPESVKVSACKIVFMGRNPFDTVVSSWKFMGKILPEDKNCIEDVVEEYCEGKDFFGPHWDHLLGYWRESFERPDKVLFLKYEDMKENGIMELKKLANFLGFGFSPEEEEQGVVENILKLCSIGNLKNLEVNKTGVHTYCENNVYFRKGEVGDWVNHFSPTLYERLDQVMKEKLAGSGLEFSNSP